MEQLSGVSGHMEREDPEEVAKTLFAALAEKRWADAADLIAPRVLNELERGVRRLEHDKRDSGPGSWYVGMFGFSSSEESRALSGRDLMAAHAQHRDPDAPWPSGSTLTKLRRTVLGHVLENSHLAHVVYRAGFYRGKKLQGEDAVNVLTLELTPRGWRAQRVDFGADYVNPTSYSTAESWLEADGESE
jgi:hypothetical protein